MTNILIEYMNHFFYRFNLLFNYRKLICFDLEGNIIDDKKSNIHRLIFFFKTKRRLYLLEKIILYSPINDLNRKDELESFLKNLSFVQLRNLFYYLEANACFDSSMLVRNVIYSKINKYKTNRYLELVKRAEMFELIYENYDSESYVKHLNQKFIDSDDRGMVDYIHKKNVAIVGPLKPKSPSVIFEELKKYDVIITMNYKFNHEYYDVNKINISYYGFNEVLSYRSKFDKEIEYFKKLDFVRIKNRNDVTKQIKESHTNVSFINEDMKFLLGGANMGPLIINDILRFNPGHIKCFNMDLYLGLFNYIEGYKRDKILFDKFIYDEAVHGLLSNYFYMKKCYDEKLIFVDNSLREALELSPTEYMAKINSLKMTKNRSYL